MAIEAFMLMRIHVLAHSHLSDAIQLFIVEGYIDSHLELTSFGIPIRTADAFDPLCIEGNTIELASSMDHLPKGREENRRLVRGFKDTTSNKNVQLEIVCYSNFIQDRPIPRE